MSPPTTFRGRFSGQMAAVTGGADGLGFAIAERLVQEGASVWILDRDEQKGAAAAARLGARTQALALDITDEPAVGAAFARIHAAGERLDVVVNSAGIVGPNHRRITETPTDGYEQVLRINLFGSFLVCKHALGQM